MAVLLLFHGITFVLINVDSKPRRFCLSVYFSSSSFCRVRRWHRGEREVHEQDRRCESQTGISLSLSCLRCYRLSRQSFYAAMSLDVRIVNGCNLLSIREWPSFAQPWYVMYWWRHVFSPVGGGAQLLFQITRQTADLFFNINPGDRRSGFSRCLVCVLAN